MIKTTLVAALMALPAGAAFATAYTIDLNTPGSTAMTGGSPSTINGALYNFDNIGSGSGTYTDMFRVQANNTESGYNYDGAAKAPFDQVGGVGNPHQLVTDIPVVTINGTQYMRLNFDANNKAGLTMTDFRMYVNNSGTPVLVSTTGSLSSLGSLIYDFNGGAGGPNTLTMTAFPSGSGTDNMTINIPLTLLYQNDPGFNPATANVYFYAAFSNSDSGFEEFAIDKSITTNVGNTPVSLAPEPKTVWGGGGMVAIGLAGLVAKRRKRDGLEAVRL